MENKPNALASYLDGRKRSDFADQVGISAGYLTQLAGGIRTPGLDIAQRIERATDGSVPIESWPKLAALLKAARSAA